jgi:hypothetical protein
MEEEKEEIIVCNAPTNTGAAAAEAPRKGGAPKGNQNARTHGFYARELDEAEKLEYLFATEVDGLDSEIALLRTKIKSLIACDPENIKLITQATNALARLIMTKYNISKQDPETFKEKIDNVLRGYVIPFGSGIIGTMLKK